MRMDARDAGATRPLSSGWRSASKVARLELRQFVEEQHALMRERNLAGFCAHAAAGQRRHARGMMRGCGTAACGQRAVADFTGNRGDHRDFQKLRY